jgi:hypothetical protein
MGNCSGLLIDLAIIDATLSEPMAGTVLLDRRTTRHTRYMLSRRKRKRIDRRSDFA